MFLYTQSINGDFLHILSLYFYAYIFHFIYILAYNSYKINLFYQKNELTYIIHKF